VADDEHRLHAEVLTPEGSVFDGDVVQLSTRTVIGEIGILANHAPLVARLAPAELRLHLSGTETRRWAQAEGWLEVFANRAVVLIGEAIPPDQLDAAELKQRLSDAEQRLAEAEEGTATHHQAERDKTRAEAFLGVAEAS
jgi:F-type H+-transporting ATPase subunit epsilon